MAPGETLGAIFYTKNFDTLSRACYYPSAIKAFWCACPNVVNGQAACRNEAYHRAHCIYSKKSLLGESKDLFMSQETQRGRGSHGGFRTGARPTNARSNSGGQRRPGGGFNSSRRPSSRYGASGGGSRSRFGGSRRPSSFGGRGGFNRGRSRRPVDARIDPSRFVNRASPIEEVSYVPTHRFIDFDLSDGVKAAIKNRGYEVPTAIQDESIPHTLKGKDVVGMADTGSGKTGAFLIPLLEKVVQSSRERVLIVVPTRELAIQIQDELHELGRPLKIDSVCCVGGANISPQLRGLRHNPRFVIGTPGRLKDVIERRALDLSHFNSIVLDEADRMLDMGFINDMRYLMDFMPKERQTLFFSATLGPDIKKLIGDFLKDPVYISVKTRDTSKNVEQDVVRVARGDSKFDILVSLLSKPEMSKVLIFGRTKHGVEKLTTLLKAKGFAADSIHGNKTHSNRQRALGKFRDDRSQILVATDVAARGLDIPRVSHVINYELPGSHDDYVHRIGRTGRANARGVALTFIDA